MTIAGRLDIDLTFGSDASAAAHIVSRRPLGVTRAFRGRRPAEVTRLVHLMFAVCRMAQGAASASACERALGLPTPAVTRCARDILVLAETAREHLLRVVMDWPRCMAMMADPVTLRQVMELDKKFCEAVGGGSVTFAPGGLLAYDRAALAGAVEALRNLLENVVFGEPAQIWLRRGSRSDLAGWARAGRLPAQLLLRAILQSGAAQVGAVSIDAMPDIADTDLGGLLFGEAAEQFVARPTWDGRPRETTALSRQFGHPLIDVLGGTDGYGIGARLAARLVELAALPDRIAALMDATATDGGGVPEACRDGIGMVRSETARGQLIHGVEIHGGLVQRYVIVAPTEWNFHPAGAAARTLGLIASSGRDDARELADLMITAFDPCVDYNLTVH
jgi:coenzyme F420-reducing hydrogenase alpha subunit